MGQTLHLVAIFFAPLANLIFYLIADCITGTTTEKTSPGASISATQLMALLSKITTGDKRSSEETATKPPENHRTSILQEIAEAVRNLGPQSRDNRRNSDR